jgi:nitrogen fixation/metabolism regulation signal transduction histidine kinase
MEGSQRKLRNLLLDRRFQLRFAFKAVALSALVAGGMGASLFWTSRELKGQADEAVDARASAAETSKELGQVALSHRLLERLGNPEVEAELIEESRRIDARYEAQRQAIVRERAELLHRQRLMGAGIAFGFGALALGVVLAGIADTHRIVGPLHRLQKLLHEVGEGTVTETPRVREHDQFRELFEAFAEMNEELRARTGRELELLDRAIRMMEAGDSNGATGELTRLKEALLGPVRESQQR